MNIWMGHIYFKSANKQGNDSSINFDIVFINILSVLCFLKKLFMIFEWNEFEKAFVKKHFFTWWKKSV